jgi:hypothetical protein
MELRIRLRSIRLYPTYLQRKPRNILMRVCLLFAVIDSFLTIDARMGRVMKRGVLQNTRSSLQAHYSSLGGPACGLHKHGQYSL